MNPPDLLIHAAAALGTEPESLRFIRYSQNFVYEWKDPRGPSKILRITSGSHRSLPEIQSELDWISHLHAGGVSVCPPLPGAEGSLIRSFPGTTGPFHCVIFAKAEGRLVEKTDLHQQLYQSHGKHLARIHRASKNFPIQRLASRKKWDEERYFTSDLRNYLPEPVQEPLLHVFRELQASLNSSPKTPDSHGPVHFDLGYSNFHLNGERLEIFDFDNCTSGWLAGDIAAALYSSVFNMLRCKFPGDRSAFENPRSGKILETVWQPFCEGYRSENGWLPEWNEQLPFWIEAMYFRSFMHACRLLYPVENERTKTLLEADVENILRRTPPLRFDFRTGKALP